MAERSVLAVILHADVVGSTELVQRDEHIAHAQIQAAFAALGANVETHAGTVREQRGDALVAEFERASDAVSSALEFQRSQAASTERSDDGSMTPRLRIGIALGEVIIADRTMTGAGVILAQRLEQLAAPGGVVIQGAVYETVPRRLPFSYQFIGEQQLKGFDEPVRAFRVVEHGADGVGPVQPSFEPDMDRTLVVLPFTNMTARPEDEPLVDGFTERVTTTLAQLPSLSVTAKESAFAYRQDTPALDAVSQTLGVRYVLRGSVQRSGDALRISAQLFDAHLGRSSWSETYDRSVLDYFAVQDDLALNIAAQLQMGLVQGDSSFISKPPTSSLKAYTLYVQARDAHQTWDPRQRTRAQALLREALEIDPEFSSASFTLGQMAAWQARRLTHNEAAELWSEAAETASRLLKEDPTYTGGHFLSGFICHFRDFEFDHAIAHFERARELSPNNPDILAQLAVTKYALGCWDEAIYLRRRAIELHPHHPIYYLHVLGYALVFRGELDEAIAVAEAGLARAPSESDFCQLHTILIQAYVEAGRLVEAHESARSIMNVEPMKSAAGYGRIYKLKDPEHTERFRERLILGGMPAGD